MDSCELPCSLISRPLSRLHKCAAYPPDALDQPEETPDLSKFVDKSEGLFTMYLERSDEDDRKVTEKWKEESDAILIFTGLFSAALAALLSVSIQDLRPNSQDTSAFYLANIYHLLANTTGTQPTIISIPADPPQFSPPTYAVFVNSLWFLSLLMSLTGALLAVFIQKWAQTYLQATQKRRNPRNRARIRSFCLEGIDNWHLHRVTGSVPTLIHISLFLFFFWPSCLPISRQSHSIQCRPRVAWDLPKHLRMHHFHAGVFPRLPLLFSSFFDRLVFCYRNAICHTSTPKKLHFR